MTLRRFLLAACGAALLAGQSLPPGEMQLHSAGYWPRSQTVVKVETRLVEVAVVVRDSRGHAVGGLTREDFEIQDSGKAREISAFSAESAAATAGVAAAPGAKPAPSGPAASAPSPARAPARYLGLVFDDFSMGPKHLVPAKQAAKRFLEHGVAAGDLVTIFSTAKGQLLPPTADAAKLGEAVDRLTLSTRNAELMSCPNLTAYESYLLGTRQDSSLLTVKIAEAVQCGFCARREGRCGDKIESMARSVWEQTRDTSLRTLQVVDGIVGYMAKLPGKRVLVLTSSGFLAATLERDREAIVDHALHSEVIINALDAKGLYVQDSGVDKPGMNVRSTIYRQSTGTRPQTESNDSMAILATSTGGLFFHNNNDLNLGFRELGLAPEYSYSLGFAPAGSPDNRYHALKVRLKQSRQGTVQARPGYYASSDKPAQPGPERKIDQEFLAASALAEAPAQFSASAVKTQSGEAGMRVVMHLDVPHLKFATQDGIRHQKITVIAGLFDESGAFVTGKEAQVEFALKETTFAQLAPGMDAGLTLVAPPGKYRLRAVAQEGIEGKMASAGQAVEIQ